MAESSFTFRVDETLKAAFTEAAKAQDRSGADLLRDFMRDVVNRGQVSTDHETWFRGEVLQAVKEADDPAAQWVSDDAARASWRRMRAKLVKRGA